MTEAESKWTMYSEQRQYLGPMWHSQSTVGGCSVRLSLKESLI